MEGICNRERSLIPVLCPPVIKQILAAAALATLAAGASAEPASPAPIRFLLSFDDGPAPSTARVLQTLAANPVQPGIKAMFFVQTRIGDGSQLMRRTHAEG